MFAEASGVGAFVGGGWYVGHGVDGEMTAGYSQGAGFGAKVW
jgi:hypothetical protein